MPAHDGRADHRVISVAVDAGGGIRGWEEVVAGAAQASLDAAVATGPAAAPHPLVEVLLVGDEPRLTEQLSRLRHNPERLAVIHTGASNPVLDAVRLAAEGRAAAVVTAGPAASTIAACRQLLRPLEGVAHPALSAVYPTALRHGQQGDPFTLLLDVGATPEADADDLVIFALMGAAYARSLTRNESPRVALLAAGSEPSAAPHEIADAAARLQFAPGLTFVGLIEAVDIPKGAADVVVTDGFAGNTVIKLLDGVREIVLGLAGYAQKQRLLWKVGLGLLSGALSQVKGLTDWEQYGGAPLLGYPQVVMRAHPLSNAHAIHNACRVAARAVAADIPGGFADLRSRLEANRS